MNTLRYKGYVGSVEASEADNCLFGHVLDLPADTEITYEGETVAELKADFVGAVDDYLAHCAAAGVEPRKSYSGSLNIRISPTTHARLAQIASSEGVSLNALIRQSLERRAERV